MRITEDEVERIATLARLDVAADERSVHAGELSNILDLVEQMNRYPTDGVEPMSHPRDMHLRLRQDHIGEPDDREKLQSIAPAAEDGLYLVPRVIE